MNTVTKIIVSIGSIAVIASAGIGGFLLATSNDATPTASSANTVVSRGTSTSDATSSATSSTTARSFKDGSYTAAASYRVPHGEVNSIKATITIAGGKISAVIPSDTYADSESGMYIDSFESSVANSAVGTSLANASFSRIGGASLTTEAFNQVLDTVRAQATA